MKAMSAVYVLCLALAREFGTSNPHTVDQVLKEHGLPLFAAKEVRVEAGRWTLWGGFWPTWAGRLVMTGFHPLESKEQARKLSDEVLLYCSEPAELRGQGDLLLWAGWVGDRMARATPLLGDERPNANILPIGPGPKTFSLPLKNPMKITLVFVDKQGRVRRTERQDIIELAYVPPKQRDTTETRLFPALPIAEVPKLLNGVAALGDETQERRVRAWVREHSSTPTRGHGSGRRKTNP